MKQLLLITAVTTIAMLLFGCSSDITKPARPGWVDKGGGFFSGDEGRCFYGVGAATNIQNVQLRRTSAETNARADLAKSFKSAIQNLVKIYARQISGSDQNTIAAENFNQEATRAFSEMTLSGAFIVDHYFDESEKTLYALTRLNLSEFKNQVEQMKELSKEIQQTILDHADEAFKEMDDMSNKEKK